MKPFKISFRIFLIAFAIILISNISFSQNQVIVNIQHPPFNRLNIEDLWKINLINTTNDNLSIYLFGTLSEENAGLIATGTSNIFTLNPGIKKIDTKELSSLSFSYPNPDPKYKESIIRTGGVPNGDYEICISVKLSNSNDDAGSNCLRHSVEKSLPISLINPDNGNEIPSGISIFTWMHMKNPGSNAKYKIVIVEVLGNQTPELAISSNPAWFTKDKLSSTILQYPISARKFEVGKEYAWQTYALERGVVLTESDVWSFIVVNPIGNNLSIIFPKTGEEIETDSVNFEWRYTKQVNSNTKYTIKIVEILEDQSPENAIKNNNTLWTKSHLPKTFIHNPCNGQEFKPGNKYAWQVFAHDKGILQAESDVYSFVISSKKSSKDGVVFPITGEEIENDSMSLIIEPKLITPNDGKTVNAKYPFFTWTYFKKPESNSKYTIKIVELLANQNPELAIISNPDWFIKSELNTSNILYPISAKQFESGKEYAWQIEVYDKGTYLMKSDTWTFIYENVTNFGLDVIFPKIGEEIEVDSISFAWTFNNQPDNNVTYSIKVVEILDGQSPEDAIQHNNIFGEMDHINDTYINNPQFEQEFALGKEYAWKIFAYENEVLIAESDISSFKISPANNLAIDILFPNTGEEIEVDGLHFEWKKYNSTDSSINYSIKIVEVFENQSSKEAIENNNYYFEESNLSSTNSIYYPDSFKIFNVGKKYAWRVTVHNNNELIGTSEVGFFIIKTTAE